MRSTDGGAGGTLNDLGLAPEIGGDVLRAARAEGAAEDAGLFGGVEDDRRGQIGDADGPIAGAEERLHQMPGGEAPPAGDHAQLRLRRHRNRLLRRCPLLRRRPRPRTGARMIGRKDSGENVYLMCRWESESQTIYELEGFLFSLLKLKGFFYCLLLRLTLIMFSLLKKF